MSATDLLVAVAWCEVRPHQGYVQKQERPARKQTGQADAADWRLLDQFVGFGGGQCLPVGQTLDQIKPCRLGATLVPDLLGFTFITNSTRRAGNQKEGSTGFLNKDDLKVLLQFSS